MNRGLGKTEENTTQTPAQRLDHTIEQYPMICFVQLGSPISKNSTKRRNPCARFLVSWTKKLKGVSRSLAVIAVVIVIGMALRRHVLQFQPDQILVVTNLIFKTDKQVRGGMNESRGLSVDEGPTNSIDSRGYCCAGVGRDGWVVGGTRVRRTRRGEDWAKKKKECSSPLLPSPQKTAENNKFRQPMKQLLENFQVSPGVR